MVSSRSLHAHLWVLRRQFDQSLHRRGMVEGMAVERKEGPRELHFSSASTLFLHRNQQTSPVRLPLQVFVTSVTKLIVIIAVMVHFSGPTIV